MKTILIQHIHANTPGVRMLELTEARHKDYCNRHGYYYRAVIGNPLPDIPPEAGNWARIKLIKDALDEGFDHVIWLDADTLIYDMGTPLADAVQENKIGVCWHRIPQLHHWNIGAMYMDNAPEVREFVKNWLASYPPPNDGWLEQGVFNRLARGGNTVVTISDKWNATFDVSMVPDAVVLGFHGQGDTDYRAEMMKRTLDKIATKESASASPADGERRT